jgi:hypothetical protein
MARRHDQRLDQRRHQGLFNLFPYVVEKTYTFLSASRSFTVSTLSPTPLKILRVEYEYGEEPPRYLDPLPMTNPKFWDGPYYEVRGEPPNQIYMGEEATIDDVVGVRYQAIHTLPAGDASTLTVSDMHLEALRLFCVWKAAEEIFLSEEIDPDTREFLVSQMGLNVIRSERLYRNKIEAYQASSLSERAGPWSMDGKNRVY